MAVIREVKVRKSAVKHCTWVIDLAMADKMNTFSRHGIKSIAR
jgi:hypothetical protein